MYAQGWFGGQLHSLEQGGGTLMQVGQWRRLLTLEGLPHGNRVGVCEISFSGMGEL